MMRHALWAILSAGGVVAACGLWSVLQDRDVAVVAAEAAAPPAKAAAEKPKGPPPLKVDRGAPLLLMDSPADKKPADKGKGPKADNTACYVCHTNYDGEEMVHQHMVANVGCVKCHGESIAHRNDENNITPPDVMFPTGAIDSACVKCHETHDAPAKKVLARYNERCAGKKAPDQLVCTDCHGEHRLKLRTVRWDKKTGKLISASGTKPASALQGEKK